MILRCFLIKVRIESENLTEEKNAEIASGKYDVLLASEFFFSTGNPVQAFKTMIEPLKPGAVLRLTAF